MEEVPPTIKAGWLTKRGRIIKSWKSRYFVLSADQLIYYTDEEQSHIKGYINLYQSTIATISQFKGRQHIFSIVTQNRTLQIQAESQDIQEDWVRVINSVVKRKEPHNASSNQSTSVVTTQSKLNREAGVGGDDDADIDDDDVDSDDDSDISDHGGADGTGNEVYDRHNNNVSHDNYQDINKDSPDSGVVHPVVSKLAPLPVPPPHDHIQPLFTLPPALEERMGSGDESGGELPNLACKVGSNLHHGTIDKDVIKQEEYAFSMEEQKPIEIENEGKNTILSDVCLEVNSDTGDDKSISKKLTQEGSTRVIQEEVVRNTYKSDSENSIKLQGYKGTLLDQQEKERDRLRSAKSSTLKEFGIMDQDHQSASSKKVYFDNAMLNQQQREIEAKKMLHAAHMKDFGIEEDEATSQTRKLIFAQSLSEQQQREARRVEALRQDTLTDFGIDQEGCSGSDKTAGDNFEVAMKQHKEREQMRRESLRIETLEDFGIVSTGRGTTAAASRRTSVADMAKQFGGSSSMRKIEESSGD